jgi:tetratricopeptide (TPR) repeat protein
MPRAASFLSSLLVVATLLASPSTGRCATDSDEDLNKELNRLSAAIKASPYDSELRFQIGDVFVKLGHAKYAIEAFKESVRLDPNNLKALQQLITIYGARQDWPNAKDCAVHWLELSPDNPQAMMLKAWCESAAGEARDACSDLEDALKQDPTSTQLNNIYGLILAERGKTTQAESAFKKALSANQSDIATNLNLVSLYLRAGKISQAKDLVLQLQAASPTEPNILALAALVSTEETNYQSAETAATKALAADNQSVLAMVALSRCLLARKEDEAALNRLKKAQYIAPNSIFVLDELASALIQCGNYKEGATTAQRALQLAPGNPIAAALLSKALAGQGNLDGAVLLLQEATARNPEDKGLRLRLAQSQEMKGDLDSAELSYRALLKKSPADPAATLGLARIALKQNQVEQSCKLSERAIELSPANAEGHLILANALFKKDRFDSSLQECRYALSLKPDEQAAILLTAHCLCKLGDWGSAIPYLTSYTKTPKAGADEWLMLVDAYEHLKNYSSAISTLERAAALFPYDQRIHNLNEQLKNRHKNIARQEKTDE